MSEKKKSAIFARLKKVKHIEIIIAVLFIAILLVVYFVSFSSKSDSSGGNSNTQNTVISAYESYAKNTEERLKTLVSGIKGAGSAEVMITFESTPEMIIAYIESVQKTTNADGTTSEQSTSTPQLISGNGTQTPIVLKELTPKPLGVLVVASGAGVPSVKAAITSAVSVVLNLSTDKIVVLERA